MKVAFQGETGAFSEEAVCALFGSAAPVPCQEFADVFEAVEQRGVERAVIPIENSLFGSVHANYDLLRTHELSIVGELQLRIRHNLMAPGGVRLEDVRVVRSHPQALGQCQHFLKTKLPSAEVVPAYDTAGAAKEVAARDRPDEAAIASVRAAEEYGLKIIEAGIESNHQNYTRFLALSREQEMPSRHETARSDWKTSIVYSMRRNVPGALFKSLAVFALRDLDLFKIESRPLVGSPGSYLFYLDVQGAAVDQPVDRALDHLREIASSLKVLGSYQRGATVE
jgi:prephenate dehydratase